MKNSLVLVVCLILFGLDVHAKVYNPKTSVFLSEDFLQSLNYEQRQYLEEKLAKKAVETFDPVKAHNLEDDYEFLDLEQIESEQYQTAGYTSVSSGPDETPNLR